ncbi:MAG: hypothetical protein NC412_00655 [Roseburia sp.]|nr:hypothetical protein [Roseburia sp.]MCM1277695.1 hypothetical protein [Robinsoniella sp.]
MVGSFGISKAGHDKDHIYIIVKEEKEYVYLADGLLRTLERPKKKKKKHIQIMNKHADKALGNRLLENQPVGDEEIKRAVKNVQKWELSQSTADGVKN